MSVTTSAGPFLCLAFVVKVMLAPVVELMPMNATCWELWQACCPLPHLSGQLKPFTCGYMLCRAVLMAPAMAV